MKDEDTIHLVAILSRAEGLLNGLDYFMSKNNSLETEVSVITEARELIDIGIKMASGGYEK